MSTISNNSNDDGSNLESHYAGVIFMNLDANNLSSLNPCTHIYQYDTGFPPLVLQKLATLFNTSYYAEFLISYENPKKVVDDYEYNVDLIGSLTVTMHGSHRRKTAYFYKRKCMPSAIMPSNCNKFILPQRSGINEEPIEVICDHLFLEGIKIAVGPLVHLHAYNEKCENNYTKEARPTRVCISTYDVCI
jgi:hypothetical protein